MRGNRFADRGRLIVASNVRPAFRVLLNIPPAEEATAKEKENLVSNRAESQRDNKLPRKRWLLRANK